MIIDLEQERKNGLDESQLAEQVMRLMKLSETCEGPFKKIGGLTFGWRCACGWRGQRRFDPGFHPRIPKPLAQVRDELIEWLRLQDGFWMLELRAGSVHVSLRLEFEGASGFVEVRFKQVDNHFPIALALGAIRLLGEKQ